MSPVFPLSVPSSQPGSCDGCTLSNTVPAVKESSESCSALQAYKARAFRNGELMGDESLDVEEVGIGLDGAENMGQDGERGDVGLGF